MGHVAFSLFMHGIVMCPFVGYYDSIGVIYGRLNILMNRASSRSAPVTISGMRVSLHPSFVRINTFTFGRLISKIRVIMLRQLADHSNLLKSNTETAPDSAFELVTNSPTSLGIKASLMVQYPNQLIMTVTIIQED